MPQLGRLQTALFSHDSQRSAVKYDSSALHSFQVCSMWEQTRPEPHPNLRQLFEARERGSRMYHWVPLTTASMVSMAILVTEHCFTSGADH